MGGCAKGVQMSYDKNPNCYESYNNQIRNTARPNVSTLQDPSQYNLFPQQIQATRKLYSIIKPASIIESKNNQNALNQIRSQSDSKIIKKSIIKQSNSPTKNDKTKTLKYQIIQPPIKQLNKSQQYDNVQAFNPQQNLPKNRKRSGSEQSVSSSAAQSSYLNPRSVNYIAGLQVISEASIQTSVRRIDLSKHDISENLQNSKQSHCNTSQFNNPFHLHSEIVKNQQKYQFGPAQPANFQWNFQF